MSQLAQAAITKYHNGVGWKNRHLFPHSFGGQNSEMRVISLLRFYRRLSSGLQMLTFLSCPNMAERRRKPSGLFSSVQFSSVQSLSRVRLFATPWIAACQASLPITNSQSSPKPTSIKSVMPSSHLILCCPLLLLPPIPPSIRVFSNESTLPIRWPKYWSFSFSIIPSKESQGWSPLEWTGWISLQSKGLSRVFSNTTFQKHQFFGAQRSS